MTRGHQLGIGASKGIAVVATVAAGGLAAWYVFAEYRQDYWDDRVRAICAEPGSVRILSKVPLSDAEYESMPRVAGRLAGFAPLELTKPLVPTYVRKREEVIREGSPKVWKTVSEVIRRSDGQVVARYVEATRLGGDALAVDQPSSFMCPSASSLYAALESVYVRRETK